jgi:hypothetical protein
MVVTRADLAAASPAAAEKETARGLMADGRAARARGDVAAAMKAFAGADAIMHVPTTGLELARMQAAAGLLVEARDTALRVTRMPEEAGEPPPFRQARSGAGLLESELEGRIPSIRVTVKSAPDGKRPLVSLDDIEMPAEVLEQALRVDPGHHKVTARAGTIKVEQEVVIAESESKDVAIELPRDSDSGGPVSLPFPSAVSRTTEHLAPNDKTRPGSRSMPALAISGFSVAGTGALTGLVAGLVAIGKTSAVRSSGECQDAGTLCNPSVAGAVRSAQTTSTLSDVAFAVAGCGAVAGVAGLLLGPSSPRTTSGIEPWFGPGALGFRGRF